MNLTKQQVFKTFDLDGDGQIQKEEMREVFAKMKLRVTANEVDMIFSTLDANNEEHIKIDEFLKWIDI
jgi:Ca2+-binding EF-hand superfamily protein